ncbi:hypothetical protein MNB_SM-7-137 [hydrothermal vent metagenome]|uniref:Methyltransferase domain-containing protein n=1 Tax=hydrothermal vent metagenome TaxID=652676 RepID=A0A1W1BC18_9ZZZZ
MPKIDPKYFYLSALQKYGISAKALCWNSKEHQYTRFEVIRQALPKDLGGITIVDAGCGFGDFWLFLQERGEKLSGYIGIESLEPFVHIAKERTKQQILHLDVLTDSLPQANYYITSGTLNTLTSFESFLFLKKCLDASKEGVIFNFLYGEKESELYNYIDDAKIAQMLESFQAEIFFDKVGYIKNDRTLGVRKCAPSLE